MHTLDTDSLQVDMEITSEQQMTKTHSLRAGQKRQLEMGETQLKEQEKRIGTLEKEDASYKVEMVQQLANKDLQITRHRDTIVFYDGLETEFKKQKRELAAVKQKCKSDGSQNSPKTAYPKGWSFMGSVPSPQRVPDWKKDLAKLGQHGGFVCEVGRMMRKLYTSRTMLS